MALYEHKRSSREDGGFRTRSEEEISHEGFHVYEVDAAKRMRGKSWARSIGSMSRSVKME